MSNDPKLTLRTLAALDAEASDLPWHAILVGPEVGGTTDGWEVWEDTLTVAQIGRGLGMDEGKEAKARFIAATKDAAPRLLALIEGLAGEWEQAASLGLLDEEARTCAIQLRALCDAELGREGA